MGVLYIGLPDGNKYGNRGTKEAWFLGEQRLKYS